MVITPRDLRKDAEGREKYMPSDIALDNLEMYSTEGLKYQELLTLPEGTKITRHKSGWTIELENCASTSKDLYRAVLALDKKFGKQKEAGR